MANPELTGSPSPLDEKAHALADAIGPHSPERRSASHKLSRGLGWFSIGLGLVEVLAARPLARWVGLPGHETLLRAYGLREIATGIGLLAADTPQAAVPWVRGRVAGDVLDLGTLAAAAANPAPGSHPAAAIAAVAGVAALDMVCARTLGQEADAARQTTDYSDRSGFPSAPLQMRGAAKDTFRQPPDMRVSPTPLGGGGAHLVHR